MVINLRRCIGCDACTIACKQAYGTPPGIFFSHVSHIESGQFPNARLDHTPMLCMHCDNPSCVTVCPTSASRKNADGTVTIEEKKCIGCRQCIVSCPYDVRNFIAAKPEAYFPEKGHTKQEEAMYAKYKQGKVYKCDFCSARRAAEKDAKPVCVSTCVASARIFGDLDDPNSEVAKLLATHNTEQLASEFGTGPNVYYIKI